MKDRSVSPPQVKQRVTFIRVLGKGEKLFDGMNLPGGTCIELCDAMTACGYWVDDSLKWLETQFEQDATRRGQGPAVEVRIEIL